MQRIAQLLNVRESVSLRLHSLFPHHFYNPETSELGTKIRQGRGNLDRARVSIRPFPLIDMEMIRFLRKPSRFL